MSQRITFCQKCNRALLTQPKRIIQFKNPYDYDQPTYVNVCWQCARVEAEKVRIFARVIALTP